MPDLLAATYLGNERSALFHLPHSGEQHLFSRSAPYFITPFHNRMRHYAAAAGESPGRAPDGNPIMLWVPCSAFDDNARG